MGLYARYLEAGSRAEGSGFRVAQLRRAFSLARSGAAESSLTVLDGAREAVGPFVTSWTALAVAEALSADGRPEGTRSALERVTDRGARVRARTLVAEAFLVAGDSAAALEAYAGALASAEAGAEAPLAVVLGELTLARGDTVAGTEALRRALHADPDSPAGARAAAMLLDLSALTDHEAARTAADALLRYGREAEGLEALELSMSLGGRMASDLPPSLRLLRASLLVRHGSPQEGARELLQLADDSAASVAGPALWHLIRLRRRQGRWTQVQALQGRLIREHPQRPEAVDVVFFQGDDFHDQGRLQEAANLYRRVVTMAPALDRAGLARMRLGQLRLEQGDVSGAVEVFQGYLAEFPTGRRWDEAAHWAGRGLLELGDTVQAREHLDRIRLEEPLSYYAVLAAGLLGEAYQPLLPEEPRDNRPPGWLERGLRDIDLLRYAGVERAVDVAVDRLTARARNEVGSEEIVLLLAEALNRRGLTPQGINLGWQLRREGRPWDPRLARVIYPLPYGGLLRREAEEWGVDPFLVAAVVRQESAFWHRAVSGAGAVGLMQVLPSTGESLAPGVGPRDFHADALLVPEVNLHLGVRFLAQMAERFGPELPLLLSAYNAGPSRAAGWRRLPEAADPLRFTERIPFSETRGYVKNVLRNRAVYEWLYGSVG